MVHMPPWALCSDGSSYEATKYDASLAWNPVDRKQPALKSASAFIGSAHPPKHAELLTCQFAIVLLDSKHTETTGVAR